MSEDHGHEHEHRWDSVHECELTGWDDLTHTAIITSRATWNHLPVGSKVVVDYNVNYFLIDNMDDYSVATYSITYTKDEKGWYFIRPEGWLSPGTRSYVAAGVHPIHNWRVIYNPQEDASLMPQSVKDIKGPNQIDGSVDTDMAS